MILRDFVISDLYRNDGFYELSRAQQGILTRSLYGNKRIAYTIENGDIIASGGIVIYWPGVCEGWGLLSSLIKTYPLASRIVKRHIINLEKIYNIKRHQTMCLNIKSHIRWLEFLGFKFESELKKYGVEGETYLQYVRLP